MNALPPAVLEQRVTCSIAASVKFNVPANLLLAVAEIENGRPGLESMNANGTRDIGLMQFNTSYLDSLAPFGIRATDVAGSDCYPFDLAAWRISGHLARDQGDLWTRAANYHSRTHRHNAIYRSKLLQAASKWETWLRQQFQVEEFAP
jgi:hypothetical protein